METSVWSRLMRILSICSAKLCLTASLHIASSPRYRILALEDDINTTRIFETFTVNFLSRA